MKLIGKKLEALKILKKHIKRFYKNLLSCMTIIFLKKIKLKAKDLKSPWITRGITKSSKRKHNTYMKN